MLQLASFMDGPDPYLRPDPLATVKQSITVLVARLASRPQFSGLTGQPAFSPALAGLRGEAAGPLTYEAGDAQIILDIQNDQRHMDRRSIVGLVIGWDDQDVQVHLWHDEQRIVSTAVDTFGNFSIDGLAPGTYELFLTGEHSEIHVQDLRV